VRHDRESLADGAEELGRAADVVGHQHGAVAGARCQLAAYRRK